VPLFKVWISTSLDHRVPNGVQRMFGCIRHSRLLLCTMP
jgi:hypothetical protein